MEESGLTDIDIGAEFGVLLKDWIEDWSDDEDSVDGDWSENGNEGEDISVSGIIMYYFLYHSATL